MNGFPTLWHLLASTQVAGALLMILTGLFGWAGSFKLRNPAAAAVALRNFRLIHRYRKWLGRATGVAEIVTATALAAPATRRFGAAAAALLAAGFVFLIARALWRGETFLCACLGPGERISHKGLWRAVAALLGALLVALAAPHGGNAATWMQATALAAIGLGALLLTRTSTQLLRLRRQAENNLAWDWITQVVDPNSIATVSGLSAVRPLARHHGVG